LKVERPVCFGNALLPDHLSPSKGQTRTEDLGLRVVSGFVEGHDGTLSGQIDCTLVWWHWQSGSPNAVVQVAYSASDRPF
jgi:hypothetical protein